MPDSIRITKGTFSGEHTAPDGSHRFPEGLVVAVGDGYHELDDATARRWVRAGFAEAFDGQAGDVVTNQEADMSPGEINAEVQRLQVLLRQAEDRRVQRARPSTPATAPGAARPAPDQPIGATPYRDPTDPHPLSRYGLTDQQRTNLERAGFTRTELVDKAADAELLEVEGIGERALEKLRGA